MKNIIHLQNESQGTDSNQIEHLDIKAFDDYKTFIQTDFDNRKAVDNYLSLRTYGIMLGMKSASTLSKILSGERFPSHELIRKMAQFYKFTESEFVYFCKLIGTAKLTKDQTQSNESSHRGYFFQDELIPKDQMHFVSNWYGTALREFIKNPNFKNDPQYISQSLAFKCDPNSVKETIQKLLDSKLAYIDSKNQLKLKKSKATTTDDISSETIKMHHESVLDLAKTAVRKFSVQEREFQSMCLNMKKERLKQAKEDIRLFQENFAKKYAEAEGDELFQFQLQMFPLTKLSKVLID